MDQCLIAVTVGTSLLNNTGIVQGHDRRERGQDPSALNEACHKAISEVTSANLAFHAGRVHSHLVHFLARDEVDEELGFRLPGKDEALEIDRLPQELSYLALLARKPQFRDGEPASLVLIASDSPAGTLCAEVIRRVIDQGANHSYWGRFRMLPAAVRSVQGLRVERNMSDTAGVGAASVFTQVGVPNLLRQLQELSQEQSWTEVIINLTGGFKGAIPFSTIAAAFLKRPNSLHYLFENTQDIIALPSYPLGLDFPGWHRQALLLEAAQTDDAYLNALDPRMRAIAAEAQSVSGGFLPDSLPDLLQKRYEEQLRRDPLQDYSEQVARQFLPEARAGETSEAREARAGLRGRLTSLINGIGPLIWLGDKLPMAADHAEKHHHNLLELAQLLLTPLADRPLPSGAPFLNDAERFVLLSGLLLHDCGHTIDALPLKDAPTLLVPLFRSEIRELHHFLAFQRLTRPRAGGVAKGLDWNPGLPLAREVAYLCLFHRRSAGWAKDAPEVGKNVCPYLDWQIPPPTEFEFDGIDFPKLVALLRLIDGCDNQNRRVGASPDNHLVKEMLNQDAATWKVRLTGLLAVAQSQCPSAPKPEGIAEDDWIAALKLLDELGTWLQNGGAAPSLGKYSESPCWRVRRQLGEACASPAAPAAPSFSASVVWLETLRAYDENRVRDNQYVHFLKHEVVRRTRLLPLLDSPGSFWRIQVRLEPDPDKAHLLDDADTALRVQQDVGGQYPSLRRWVEAEVQTEVSEDILAYLSARCGHPMSVEFFWKENTGDHLFAVCPTPTPPQART